MPAKPLTPRRAALASFAGADAHIVPTVAADGRACLDNATSSLIEAPQAAREAFNAGMDAVEATKIDGETLIRSLGGASITRLGSVGIPSRPTSKEISRQRSGRCDNIEAVSGRWRGRADAVGRQ
jgi:hypothetical protein